MAFILLLFARQPTSSQAQTLEKSITESHTATCASLKASNAARGDERSLIFLKCLCRRELYAHTSPSLHLHSLFYMLSSNAGTLRFPSEARVSLSLSLSHPASLGCLTAVLPLPSLPGRLKAGSRCFVTRRSESLRETEPL